MSGPAVRRPEKKRDLLAAEALFNSANALTELISHYRQIFPWYARLLKQLGASELSPLRELPIIDEVTLNRHYYTAPNDHLPDAEGYLTSGTQSGRRKRILYSREDQQAYIAHRRTIFAEFLETVPRGSVAAADLGTGHAADTACRIFTELGLSARHIDFSRPLEEHVELLNQWQPAVLYTMPAILDRLLASPSLRFSPQKIIVVGDLAPASWRRHVAERLGISCEGVLDIFGSIEIGAIAHYVTETGLYHFHDHILPEVVAPNVIYEGCDVELEGGILLLTSFARRYFPALRFATNDIICGFQEIIVNGRRVFGFERIAGRFGGEIKYGERISHYDICAAVADVFGNALFEVVNDGSLEVRIVADRIDQRDAEKFINRLMAACPDVRQMLASGLIAPIQITSINATQLSPSRGKRLFNLRKGA